MTASCFQFSTVPPLTPAQRLAPSTKHLDTPQFAASHRAFLAVLQARCAALEAELSELSHELELRSEMEAALKEAIKEADREAQRARAAAAGVNIEYLKNTVRRILSACYPIPFVIYRCLGGGH